MRHNYLCRGILSLYLLWLFYLIIVHKWIIQEYVIPESWGFKPNFYPFKNILGYIQHWYYHRLTLNIILRNLLGYLILFIPIGVLLPLCHSVLNKRRFVLAISFVVALVLQILKEVTNIGIGDIDDIILACSGAIIGCGLYRLWHTIKWKKILAEINNLFLLK